VFRVQLDRALPLLRLVSFPIGVTGEGAKRTLGLVAGGESARGWLGAIAI
jgi:hypothetical protein